MADMTTETTTELAIEAGLVERLERLRDEPGLENMAAAKRKAAINEAIWCVQDYFAARPQETPETGGEDYVSPPLKTRPATAAIHAPSQAVPEVEGLAWRPIDTAPRNGTEFQGWTDAWEPRCRFNADGAFEIWGRVDYDKDGWDIYSHLTPTHWMPYPSRPAAQAAQPVEGE
jgi:hypothetical protein